MDTLRGHNLSPLNRLLAEQIVLLNDIQANANKNKEEMQRADYFVVDFRTRPEERCNVLHAEYAARRGCHVSGAGFWQLCEFRVPKRYTMFVVAN